MSLFHGNYGTDTSGDSSGGTPNALPLAGGVMTGTINMGGNQITDTADPTTEQSAATKKYIDDNYVSNASAPLAVTQTADPLYVKIVNHMKGGATGDISMGASYRITQAAAPTSTTHVTNKGYTDGAFVAKAGSMRKTDHATWYYASSGSGEPQTLKQYWPVPPLALTKDSHIVVVCHAFDDDSNPPTDLEVTFTLKYGSAAGRVIYWAGVGSTGNGQLVSGAATTKVLGTLNYGTKICPMGLTHPDITHSASVDHTFKLNEILNYPTDPEPTGGHVLVTYNAPGGNESAVTFAVYEPAV